MSHTLGPDSVTKGQTALDLFKDRYVLTRHFLGYLNDLEPRAQILFLYGAGGNGKSLLLKYLRMQCCKRFAGQENWAYIRECADEELKTHIESAEGASLVPSALVDFGMKPQGEDRPQEAMSALLMLQRQLAGSGLRFPLFNFACIWYLHKTGRLTQERLRALLPGEAMDVAVELMNLVKEVPGVGLGKAVLSLFGKHLQTDYTLWHARHGLSEELIQRIQGMDAESELLDHLPALFAADVNSSMAKANAPKRVVLFFDTHEAFWGEGRRHLAGESYFQRDEWLRRLLAPLELQKGIVVVVAGREKPKWNAESGYRGEYALDGLDLQPVEALPNAYALEYLEDPRTGVTDPAMRQFLLNYARQDREHVHPLLLGLGADVVRTAAQSGVVLTPADFRARGGKGKLDVLVDRLLRYTDEEVRYAVQALAACRSFDYPLYRKLGEKLEFQVSRPAFAVLTQFSFVGADEGQERFHIHDLLRRLLRETAGQLMRQADEELEAHYRELADRGDEAAVVEAIYHANMQDWERGAQEWVTTMDNALQQGRYGFLRSLLDLRGVLEVRGPLAGVASNIAGDFFLLFSRHGAAEQEFSAAVAAFDQALCFAPEDAATHNNRGNALQSLGGLQAGLSRHEEALVSYRTAIAAYDQALGRTPYDPDLHSNKGNALSRLGKLQALLSQHSESLASYCSAIAAYDQALDRAPYDIYANNNKGNALKNLGDLQAGLSRHTEAMASYSAAIAAFDQALNLAPDDIRANNNKGIALQSLGDLQAGLSQHEVALATYRAAIVAHDRALNLSPDDPEVYSNKGIALQSLGDLHSELSQHEEALANYRAAIAAHDQALERAPDDPEVHNNRGSVLASLGDLQAGLSQHEEALASYHAAIAAHDQALDRAPYDIYANNNKGNALQKLGRLQARLSRHTEAMASYSAAIVAHDQALACSPDYIYAINNKGTALNGLGDLQARLSRQKEAMASYRGAIAAYDQALDRAPDYINAHSNKGVALQTLGDLQAGLSQHEEALASYHAAIAAHDQALGRAPDDIYTHNNKGNALQRLGDLQAGLSQQEEALASYLAAIGAYDQALDRAPAYINAFNNKGNALSRLGETQARLSQHNEALASYSAAIAAYEKAVDRAPHLVQARYNKGNALSSLGDLRAGLSQDKDALASYRAAIAAYDQALSIAPNLEQAQHGKASVLAKIQLLEEG